MLNLDYEKILLILKIALGVCGFLATTIVPLVIKLVQANKKRKEAKTEAEKAEAEVDMLNTAILLIDGAESLYEDVDTVLKREQKSAHEVKKDNVMTKLQSYAIEKNYYFDADKWSEVIDNIVKFTKRVNGKTNTNVKVGG